MWRLLAFPVLQSCFMDCCERLEAKVLLCPARIAPLLRLRVMELDVELLTGIQEIDHQHEKLFQILDELRGIVAGGDTWSAVYFALSELAQFSHTHFVVEEALMRLHGYPDLESHIAEHRLFSERLAKLGEQAVRTDVRLPIIEFIEQWLVGHIGVSDKAYVPCLRTMPVV